MGDRDITFEKFLSPAWIDSVYAIHIRTRANVTIVPATEWVQLDDGPILYLKKHFIVQFPCLLLII